MNILRTRLAKDIIVEFLPPQRKTKETRVIIFCDGVPTVPSKKTLLNFWSKKGFWVFHPRYRGTWESSGQFLQHPLQKDILDVINAISKPFTSLWDDKKFSIKPNKIFLFANSFGGPAAIFSSLHKRVNKVILISPVTDWVSVHKVNSRDAKIAFVEKAYGKAYRIHKHNWNKLKTGKFYNPAQIQSKVNGSKLIIFHAKDDESVPYHSVEDFAKNTNSKFVSLSKGGHFGTSLSYKPYIYKKIVKFLKEK